MLPALLRIALLLGGMVTGLATHHEAAAQPVRTGPAGAAFYQAPSPLPRGERGSVIWARPLAAEASLPSAASNLLVLYRSTDPAGNSVAVSGTVAIPAGTPPAGGWPVITWAHGTTGLAPICAPSLDTPTGPEHPYLAGLRTLLDGFVKRGYAVVATDYQGLGTPGPHPFLQGQPNGRNVLDMLRAARRIEAAIGTRYLVMGHSQGGHAALFAGAEGPAYVPELTQVGTLAFAPGSQIMGRLNSVRQAPDVQLAVPYVLYALQSYAGTNQSIDLRRMLAPGALVHLPDLHEQCMTHALTTGYWSTAVARDQFLPQPDLTAFSSMAAKNEPGMLRIAAPTMIMQGTADVTVPPGWTDSLAGQLCSNGTSLAYRPVSGSDHNGVMVAGAMEAHGWVAARFAGEAPASNCGALPKAGGG
ncbi:lipase [Siccirubricoccus deserti]|uniref:Alpha/beta fold hydrolase n=1 Tax=Siccirubricoccus deserti TaxID=2013562 RepID=A0A9X0UBG7_9PROT|nr:lipase family protein [Siccirubricoccus deserti]MBC4013962.1 alpha/beta fold hydrolase [Siccirubricoccus deserti]GGC30924.1 lipase [Siccirubricoccus deserti]